MILSQRALSLCIAFAGLVSVVNAQAKGTVRLCDRAVLGRLAGGCVRVESLPELCTYAHSSLLSLASRLLTGYDPVVNVWCSWLTQALTRDSYSSPLFASTTARPTPFGHH